MSDVSRRTRWLLAAAAALIAASLACGSSGSSAPASNPPTLTPTIAAATQAPVNRPTSQPTAAQSAGDLKVGGHAEVHTTAGDKLRIHSRPSFDAPVTVKLADGTRVTIVAGPQTVGADRWWQIETADGESGWAVESAEGIQTLQAAP
jgi:hypothetical protein